MPPPLPSRPLGVRLLGTSDPTIVVEVFQDLCCPFSKKVCVAMNAEDGILSRIKADPALASAVEIVFHPVPQPWHPQSPVMHECLMAVSLAVDRDPAAVRAYITASYDNFDEFTDREAMDLSRVELHERCAAIAAGTLGTDEFGLGGPDAVRARVMSFLDLSRLTKEEPHMALGAATRELKFAVKHHRIRGVHVTPTVFVNGIEASDVSSGWTPEQWIEKLRAVNEGRA